VAQSSVQPDIVAARTTPQARDKIVERVKLEAERQIPAITQQRHLKDVEKIDKGDRINPLGERKEIPQFPKETARESANP
jgi:hypothetical protein